MIRITLQVTDDIAPSPESYTHMIEHAAADANANVYTYVYMFMRLLLSAGFDQDVIVSSFNDLTNGNATYDELTNYLLERKDNP